MSTTSAIHIGLSEASLGDEEKKAVVDVLESGWITQGEMVAAFEAEFSRLHGFDNSIAVSSCTAGLHLALEAIGVGPGDEVLVPSLTFVAGANTVVQTGATPVFVDIESVDCPHISLDDAKAKVTAATRAIMIMDYGGYLIDDQPWKDLAAQHNAALIDDAAHAVGIARHQSRADFSTYSFFGNKNITTAEGGMVCVRDEARNEQCRRLRSHGMTTSTLDRRRGHAFSYDVSRSGFNYRMDEIRAAIGIAQLNKVEQWTGKRQELMQHYRLRLADLGVNVTVPFTATQATACHLMPVVLPASTDRNAVMTALKAKGVQSSIHYPPIHQFSFYAERYPGVRLPATEDYCARELTIPLHPGLDTADVDYVVETLDAAIKQSV